MAAETIARDSGDATAPASAAGSAGMFAALRAAHAREPATDWSTRARRLRALKSLILDNRAAIAAAIAVDFGRRPAEETDLVFFLAPAAEIGAVAVVHQREDAAADRDTRFARMA